MRKDNNVAIPVIIGVVGGAQELESVEPIFREFHLAFGDSIPVKVLQAVSPNEIRFFNKGDKTHKTLTVLHNEERSNLADDVATYLLRNCHFVVLSATLDKNDPIRCSVENLSKELPDGTPQVQGEDLSVFDLPQPAPILSQCQPKSLKLEIVGRQHQSVDPSNEFSLGLFEYTERIPSWKFWLGLVAEPNSIYASNQSKASISYARGVEDEMGRRWLDCVKALHRQATFNDEKWSGKIEQVQLDRIGFPSVDAVPHDPESSDLKNSFQVQCKADSLASIYQVQWQKLRFAVLKDIVNKQGFPQRFSSFLWLGGISAAALVYSTEFSGLFNGWSGIVASLIYIAILLWCFWRYIEVRKNSWEQKHQDYRFIAEVLAIQLHWMSVGIKKYASNHFPSGIKNDIQWVQRVVHTCRYLSKVNTDGPLKPDEVKNAWIDGKDAQLEYHRKTLRGRREAAFEVLSKQRRLAGKLFVAFFLLFSLLTAYELGILLAGHHAEWWNEQAHHVIIVLMAVSLVLYALLGEAIDGYGIEQELTRSESLIGVYERCAREFENPDADDDKKRKLLMAVGSYAIDAEAHWLIIHRERPMQPVKGG